MRRLAELQTKLFDEARLADAGFPDHERELALAFRRPLPAPTQEVKLLLAPNQRPQQVTQDLHSFWQATYPQVKKELAGRYPKHAWPDNPWDAAPERRARPRRRS